jgi:mono/diheme cytochrome c family protein
MKTNSILPLVAVIFITATAFKGLLQKDPWPVPDKYMKMANPVTKDASSVGDGKALWTQHCQSCHGKTGKGDGPKSGELKTEPGDMTAVETQKQPDGALYYKVAEGRKDMPSFKKKIPDADDIWSLVNFMRSLKK